MCLHDEVRVGRARCLRPAQAYDAGTAAQSRRFGFFLFVWSREKMGLADWSLRISWVRRLGGLGRSFRACNRKVASAKFVEGSAAEVGADRSGER